MVKYTSALFLVALIAGPAIATSQWDDFETRELSEVFGRDLTDTEVVYAREVDQLFARVAEDLEARDYDFQELHARKFFKKLFGGLKKAMSFILRREDGDELQARDFEEFEERELDALIERHFAELEERSPGILQFMKDGMQKVKQMAHGQPVGPSNDSDLDTREFDDLEERDYLDSNFDIVERDFEDEDVFEREYDEGPFFERDFLDAEDMYERDFEEDFQEREIDELD